MKTASPALSSGFETEEEEANHTAWLNAKIETSLADSRPNIAHDTMMAKAYALLESKKKIVLPIEWKAHAADTKIKPSPFSF